MNLRLFFLILIVAMVGVASASIDASITANSTCHIGVPVPVQFSGYCAGDGVTNVWDFGDGDTSDEQDPVHVYETYGSFTISHECAEGEETAFDEDYITISPEGACPDASCTIESGCVGSQSVEVVYDPVINSTSAGDIGYSIRSKNKNIYAAPSSSSEATGGIESTSESTLLNEGTESSGIEAVVTNSIPAKAQEASGGKGLSFIDYVLGGSVILVIGAVLLMRGVP